MIRNKTMTDNPKIPFHRKNAMAKEDVYPFIEYMAGLYIKQFLNVAINMGIESATEAILQLKHVQERNSSREAVALMKHIFDTAGKTDASKALNFLDTCAQENNFVYEMFMDAFLGADEIDWFLMEKLLTDAEYADDKRLN